jgi:uncharacterized membrane protein
LVGSVATGFAGSVTAGLYLVPVAVLQQVVAPEQANKLMDRTEHF